MYKARICKKISLFLILACFMTLSFASFHKNLWPMWEVNNPRSKTTISHQQWQIFLDKYIVLNEEGINMVDYNHLTAYDIEQLKNYIRYLSSLPIDDYNRNEQLAFWLNLYNALTVYTVAMHYPVGSIQEINISPGLFSIGPWGANLVTINKTPLSLDDIHNRIIRPIWNDARTHYAINNASIGAPNLNTKVFQSAHLDEQLNNAAMTYINSLRGAQVIEGRLIISKIYDWFEEDFGGTKMDVIKHFFQFAEEPLRSQLKHTNSIDSYVYNWHLNSLIPKD
jgi:hypothetical protein